MVKTEIDDDAPLPIPGTKGAQKPQISRKQDGSFVIKFPDGREKPIEYAKLPEKMRLGIEAKDRARKQAIAAKRQVKQEPAAKKRKLKIKNDDRPKKKKTPKKSKRSSEAGDDTDGDVDDAAAQARMSSMRANRSSKDNMIAEFLSRWWYVWEEYPPSNFDYSDGLKANKLREVEIEQWEDAPKLQGGLKKCYQLATFPGLFRDCEQHLHDLRPNENKPSYNYLNAKGPSEIAKLLQEAYAGQIKEIKKSPYLRLLPGHVEKLEVKYDKYKRMAH